MTTFGPAPVNQANHLPHPRSLPTIIAERGCEQEVQVGLFGKKEVPTTGRMLLSFEPAEFGAVMYTLDQGDSGRSWQVVGTQLLTADDVQKLDQDPNADHQQMINVMIHNALARVRELGIPSLTVGEMRVEIDHPKVGVVGAVRFLDSEWQKKRSEAQDGEKFAPGPNWKSRE